MHVFTYGSLMFPEVWSRVVRGDYRKEVARVSGFARRMVRDETYPGAIAMPEATLEGVVWFDVAAEDLDRLDRFEGEDYRRITVTAQCATDGPRAAALYLYLPVERLLPEAWLPGDFDMARFLATYGGGVP